MKTMLDKEFDKTAYAEASAKYWKDLYKSVQDDPRRMDIYTRLKLRNQGAEFERNRIIGLLKGLAYTDEYGNDLIHKFTGEIIHKITDETQ
jgi:hypothetical protein